MFLQVFGNFGVLIFLLYPICMRKKPRDNTKRDLLLFLNYSITYILYSLQAQYVQSGPNDVA